MDGGGKRRSGVTSTARPTMDHGGMALQSFGGGRAWMDTCRMVALSGIVVASAAGLARLMQQYNTEDELVAGGRWPRRPHTRQASWLRSAPDWWCPIPGRRPVWDLRS